MEFSSSKYSENISSDEDLEEVFVQKQLSEETFGRKQGFKHKDRMKFENEPTDIKEVKFLPNVERGRMFISEPELQRYLKNNKKFQFFHLQRIHKKHMEYSGEETSVQNHADGDQQNEGTTLSANKIHNSERNKSKMDIINQTFDQLKKISASSTALESLTHDLKLQRSNNRIIEHDAKNMIDHKNEELKELTMVFYEKDRVIDKMDKSITHHKGLSKRYESECEELRKEIDRLREEMSLRDDEMEIRMGHLRKELKDEKRRYKQAVLTPNSS
ncbi:unnamed protein product [Moneuplotes crassus]|uniref:Uncharacterized protein n=1 Tax=Euplotes crassus TaxID=5936 RepID=A0AAD2CW28_EUPCR|nr:unnamed protein product [Moneuplotes crassus]